MSSGKHKSCARSRSKVKRHHNLITYRI